MSSPTGELKKQNLSLMHVNTGGISQDTGIRARPALIHQVSDSGYTLMGNLRKMATYHRGWYRAAGEGGSKACYF